MMMLCNRWLANVVILLGITATISYAGNLTYLNNEHRLYDDLKANYLPFARPVEHERDSVQVSVAVSLISLEHIDEGAGVVSANIWLKLAWTDVQLQWAPEKYGGIKDIRIPVDQLWSPDIVLFNNADDKVESSFSAAPVVSSTGNVLWIPPMRVRANCDFNMKSFPFDKHVCNLKFGSWAYHDGLVNVSMMGTGFDFDDVVENREWEMMKPNAVRNAVKYPCCPDTYPDVTCSFTLRRRSSYHVHVFFAPSLALAFMSTGMFILPVESAEKIHFGVGALICQFIMLHMLEEFIPVAHSDPPFMAKYIIFNIILLCVGLFVTCIIQSIWHTSSQPQRMPGFIKLVFLKGLGCCLCVRDDGYTELPKQSTTKVRYTDGQQLDTDSVDVEDDTKQIVHSAINSTRYEWRRLSVVVDRLFLLVFLVLTILGTFILF